MPGSDNCGRCGSSLRLATAVIDVHPPRAGRVRKGLRRGAVPMNRAIAGARDAMAAAGENAGVRRLAGLAPWSLFARLALPGWSHFYAGQRVRGHLFLWGTLIFLLPGLILLGTFAGSMLLGLAFSVHSSAALDIVTQTFPDAGMRARMARSVLVSIVLALVVYVPLGLLLMRVADPTVIHYSTAPFQTGDVLLVNHWAKPRPGQVVMYEIPSVVQTNQRNRFVHFTGERMDRILAGPGDDVFWENGRLTVNGVASDRLPLNPAMAPKRLAVTVPDDHFLILATTTPYVGPNDAESMWLSLSLVSPDRLMGRVYARTHPLSRLAMFE